MIVPLIGNVTYPITLDPTVWIFDDRKVEFDKAFDNISEKLSDDDELAKASSRWDRAVSESNSKPPVNRSISKLEGQKVLKGTYVMPIKEFVEHSEANADAKTATLIVENNEDVTITLEELKNSYLLFALNGKTLKDDGPVHFYHKDGSNKDNPIKSVQKIVIN